LKYSHWALNGLSNTNAMLTATLMDDENVQLFTPTKKLAGASFYIG